MIDYHELQLNLEDEMVSKGADRYAENLKRGLDGTDAGKVLMRRALRPTVEALEVAMGPRKGRPQAAIVHISGIAKPILADITMRRLLDCAYKEETLLKTCRAIATAVEWHVKDAALNEASTAIWDRLQVKLRKTPNPTFRRKSIDGTVEGIREWAEREQKPELVKKLKFVRGLDWNIKEQIAVGGFLIEVFNAATKMTDTKEIRMGRKKSKVVVYLTAGTREWLDKRQDADKLMRPVHLPMVVPPLPWTGMRVGGYLDNSKAGVKFMKTKSKAQDLESLDLQDIYDSVNLIQETPWRINRDVYGVMRQIWDNGTGVAGVPPKFASDGARSLPRIPKQFEHMSNEERATFPEWKAWKNTRRGVHEYNSDLMAECRAFTGLMTTAEQFAGFPAFYHPHKLDWRQRAYPISMFLNPQGDQFNKGLIQFSRGKRMGDNENSAAWLAIHGANVWGEDKVSFEDRIAWVQDNHLEILTTARDPLGCAEYWTQADKPFPFLAFCFEYAGWTADGDDHVTHLPVALDGANSGLQHLSCMLRDPDGAKITCVAPGAIPEDVYQMVADQVEVELTYLVDEPWAQIWKGKVSRKIAKQPTMTYTYSATESGMRGQIEKALHDLDKDARDSGIPGYLPFTDASQTNADAAKFLATIVRKAIAARMSKAAEAMTFLQECAQVYSQTGLPLRWKTPLGVPVVQYYPKTTSELLNLFINGTRHRLKVDIELPNVLDKRKAKAGVSPNYVHSMDSTHLLWTVMHVADNFGVEDFAMIHDSFGTHATGCDAMAYSLREMMVTLYDTDRLAEFRQAIVDALGDDQELIDELPAVPAYGTFDVSTVRDSDYFFA